MKTLAVVLICLLSITLISSVQISQEKQDKLFNETLQQEAYAERMNPTSINYFPYVVLIATGGLCILTYYFKSRRKKVNGSSTN